MIEDFYNSSALVEQVTRVAANRRVGSVATTYSTRITSLSCRMAKKNISETDDKGKMTVREVWRLYCAATSTNKAIVESDRVTISSRIFQVTGIYNPGLLDRHLEINLSEIR